MDLLFGEEPNAYSVGLASRLYYVVGFGLLGFGAAVFHNVGRFRPLMSGIHKHVIGTAVGVGLGETLPKYRQKRAARKDAMLKHYIELHPELFEEPAKLKYKDILEPWVPIR